MIKKRNWVELGSTRLFSETITGIILAIYKRLKKKGEQDMRLLNKALQIWQNMSQLEQSLQCIKMKRLHDEIAQNVKMFSIYNDAYYENRCRLKLCKFDNIWVS